MEPISSLSRVNVYTHVTGATGAEDVEVAFTAPGAEPAEDDWYVAAWGAPTATGCTARILIGPGAGAVTLTDGTYSMWVRVTAAVQQPVLEAGQVSIT